MYIEKNMMQQENNKSKRCLSKNKNSKMQMGWTIKGSGK